MTRALLNQYLDHMEPSYLLHATKDINSDLVVLSNPRNTPTTTTFPYPGGMYMTEENTVFIGRKPTMNYVLAVVTQFNSGSEDVVIKARGKAISRAVDVAEIVRHRFVPEAKVKDIKISTEPLKREDGESTNVSSIEIFIEK